MSNSLDATNMIQATQRELKPKLRFLEFRDAGEWDEKRLDEMFDFHSTANNSRADLSNAGNIFYIHYGDIHTKFHQYIDFSKDAIPKIPSSLYKNATFLKNGDLVIADASEDTEGIAKAVEVRGIEDGVKAISGLHTILLRDSQQNYINGFKGLLREIAGVKKQIKRLAVGVKVYSVSKTVLKQVLLPLPSHPEQQKIADCLSSIDDLITAQTQKLDKLKTHKKGLMQQLFPAEGETLPKLRFPEFRDTGEWKHTTVKEAFTIFQGFAFASSDNAEHGVRWLKIADVGIQKMELTAQSHLPYEFVEKYQKFSVKRGDYVIALTRPFLNKQLKIAAVNSLYDGALLNQRVGKLMTSQHINFIYFLLQTSYLINEIEKNISGSEPPNLSAQQIEDISVYIPLKVEQQKIADCLSSIDELITAQTHKLATLKTHKKGLMQQLFPALDEVQR